MRSMRIRSSLIALGLGLGVVLLAPGLSLPAAWAEFPAGTAPWEFRIGPVFRTDTQLQVDWSVGSVASRTSPYYTSQSSGNAQIGPVNGYANRDYEDGFVYTDPGTADPETDVPGLTWYWGYDNAGQFTGDAVQFHSGPIAEYRVEGLPAGPWSDDSQVSLAGLNLSGGRQLWKWRRTALGVSGGASWFLDQQAQFAMESVVARETSRTWRYVDTYSAPYDPFPSAPYEGSFEGPGYLLHNQPDSRDTETLSNRSVDWVAKSRLEVDVGVLDLRLGPSLWVELNDSIGLRFSPQFRAAQVTTQAKAQTIISPTRSGSIYFEDSQRERDWLLGGGLEAEVRVLLALGWHIGLAVSCDWWNDDVVLSADPFDARVALGQWSYSLVFGVEF